MRRSISIAWQLAPVLALLVVLTALEMRSSRTLTPHAVAESLAPTSPAGENAALIPVAVDQEAPAPPHFLHWEDAAAAVVFALKAGKVDEAYQCQRCAMELVTPGKPGDLRPARTIVLLGETHESAERPDLAEQAYLEAIAAGEQAVGRDDASLAELLDDLANFYDRTGRLEDASKILVRILRIVETAPTPPPREVANRARNLALLYERLGRRTDAETMYRLALVAGDEAGPGFESDLVQDMLLASAFYRGWLKYDEAIALAKGAEDLALRASGSKSMDVAFALDARAAALMAAGRPGEAKTPAEQALSIAEEQLGAESPDLASRLTLAAQVHAALHEKSEACSKMDRAMALTANDLGNDSVEMAALLRSYAAVLETVGEEQQASDRLRQAESLENPQGPTPTLAD